MELLSELDPYEKGKLCDVFESRTYVDGEYIIKQGEIGKNFYFIESGEAIATKSEDGKDKIVFEYKEHDYFGELSLIRDQPRAANVIAKGELKVCTLDRNSFNRLLGPLTDLLKRNTAKYEKYVGKVEKAE